MTGTTTTAKPAKNQFRCYHCREVFGQRDGGWFNWNEMQVHLCGTCAKLTAKKPERTGGA